MCVCVQGASLPWRRNFSCCPCQYSPSILLSGFLTIFIIVIVAGFGSFYWSQTFLPVSSVCGSVFVHKVYLTEIFKYGITFAALIINQLLFVISLGRSCSTLLENQIVGSSKEVCVWMCMCVAQNWTTKVHVATSIEEHTHTHTLSFPYWFLATSCLLLLYKWKIFTLIYRRLSEKVISYRNISPPPPSELHTHGWWWWCGVV